MDRITADSCWTGQILYCLSVWLWFQALIGIIKLLLLCKMEVIRTSGSHKLSKVKVLAYIYYYIYTPLLRIAGSTAAQVTFGLKTTRSFPHLLVFWLCVCVRASQMVYLWYINSRVVSGLHWLGIAGILAKHQDALKCHWFPGLSVMHEQADIISPVLIDWQ